jgi:hypothetical protein
MITLTQLADARDAARARALGAAASDAESGAATRSPRATS